MVRAAGEGVNRCALAYRGDRRGVLLPGAPGCHDAAAEQEVPTMQTHRPFLAIIAVAATLLLPALAAAQPAPGAAPGAGGSEELITRIRGTPGSRVGGATRGLGSRARHATPAVARPAARPAPVVAPSAPPAG